MTRRERKLINRLDRAARRDFRRVYLDKRERMLARLAMVES